MTYRDPATVVAPKTRWKLESVLCNTGQDGWSVAKGSFDGAPVLAIRWNGSDEQDGPGNPQSHGQPTWFIVPEELNDAISNIARSLDKAQPQVICEITRPDTWGAWRIEIRLEGGIADGFMEDELNFALPNLPDRFFRADPPFVAAPSAGEKRWRGRFVQKRWEGVVQTNGPAEDSNQTPIMVVRDSLVAAVLKRLEPWRHVQYGESIMAEHR